MPTIRGWSVAAIGVSLVVAGRLFGSASLVQLGYGFVILVVAAVIVARYGRHELELERSPSADRVRPGEASTVDLRLRNNGRRAAPLLLLEDELSPGLNGKARFAIHGIEPAGERSARYVVTPARRGRYSLGPLTIAVVDPFGMAQRRTALPAVSTLLVHPRIEPIVAPKEQGDRRSIVSAARRNPTGARGEDFYTLREYVEGDDLRRIHWPSTAKRDRYMIRQEETPWHTRATILIDDDAAAHDATGPSSSFERAVECGASLVELCHRLGYGYRIRGGLDAGVPAGRGSSHRNRCLDFLALVEPKHNGEARDPLTSRLMEIDAASTPENALFVVTGTPRPEAVTALLHARRHFRNVVIVCFPVHRFGSQSTKSRWEGESNLVEATRAFARAGIACIALGPDESLSAGWNSYWQSKAAKGESQWAPKPELV